MLAKRETPASPAPGTRVAATPASPDYEAARQHFVRHSEKLREQAILAEKLLDGLSRNASPTNPVILQQELRLRCAPGATSKTRFIVVNCLARTADVHFRTGHVHGLSAEVSASVRIEFDPECPRLGAGAEQEVEMLVGVAPGDGLPDTLEFGVDVLCEEQLLLKLWVRVALGDGGGQ